MLTCSTEQLKLSCLLSSRDARNAVVERILDVSFDIKSLTSAYKRTLHDAAGIQWRQNEYNVIAEQCVDGHLPNLSLLQDFFDRFFVIDGMAIYANEEYLEEYNAICRDVHPYCIVAYKLAELVHSAKISIGNLENLSENITETVVKHDHIHQYAENHLHLGGARDNNDNLIHILEGGKNKRFDVNKLPDKYKYSVSEYNLGQECNIYRELFICLNGLITGLYVSADVISEFKHKLGQIKRKLPFMSERIRLNFSNIASNRICFSGGQNSSRILRIAAKQYQKNYSDSALLLYLTSLFTYLRENYSGETVGLMVSLFLHQMNIFRSAMVMSHGNGLSQFVEYYGSGLRKSDHIHTKMSSIRNTFVGGTKRVEFRSGELTKPEELSYVLKEIGKTLQKKHPEYALAYRDDHIWSSIPHPSQQHILFNCGYHLPKFGSKSPSENAWHLTRYIEQYSYLHGKAIKVLKFYNTAHNQVRLSKAFKNNVIAHDIKETLDKFTIDTRLLLRTLDAAGDENLVPPEVFAPFARWIRNRAVNLNCNSISKRMRRLRLAFHAGEDFCHIVTGMRRIDETIKFMDYEKGDRLGHALAIGLNPVEWLRQKSEILIPIHELFDNFVWLWKMSLEMTPLYPEANLWTDHYAHNARTLGQKLYPLEGTIL